MTFRGEGGEAVQSTGGIGAGSHWREHMLAETTSFCSSAVDAPSGHVRYRLTFAPTLQFESEARSPQFPRPHLGGRLRPSRASGRFHRSSRTRVTRVGR